MEDAAIVDLYWQRSDRAIRETENKYGRYCHTIANNICRNESDAEECVNDTWLKAWNLMPDKRPALLSPFLGCITRTLALDRLRTRSRLKRGGGQAELALDELSDCLSGESDPARQVEEQELAQAVGAFVAALPDVEKRVFVARYWYLTPVEDIARRMDFSQSKVKSMLYRTRGKLGRYLREEGLC